MARERAKRAQVEDLVVKSGGLSHGDLSLRHYELVHAKPVLARYMRW